MARPRATAPAAPGILAAIARLPARPQSPLSRIALLAALAWLAPVAASAAEAAAPAPSLDGREVETIRPMTFDLGEPVFLKAGALLCPQGDERFGKDCRIVKGRTPVQVVRLGNATIRPRLLVRSLAAQSDVAGWVDQGSVEN